MNRVIIPLDVPSHEAALALVDRLGEEADFYKVGLELYTIAGPDTVRALVDRGKRVFLDLKLHDIPNTVGRAVGAAAELGVELLTVHGAGGPSMLEAAVAAHAGGLKLLAVTVLTSLSQHELGVVWGRGIASVREEVGRLTQVAHDVGVDGVVASALEAAWVRRHTAAGFLIVTPGIRPTGASQDDQRRVATPAEAVRAGADYLVIGRPITGADDPRAALAAIHREIAETEGSA
jgi:orotidine-5'-phosphate decarboxylase